MHGKLIPKEISYLAYFASYLDVKLILLVDACLEYRLGRLSFSSSSFAFMLLLFNGSYERT